MAVVISWIKTYTSANDGDILTGQNLGDMQYAIEQHTHTDLPGSVLEFPDMPASYTGYAGYFLRVNATESGFEFALAGGGSAASYTKTFTPSDVSLAGDVSVVHNLGVKYVLVQIYDNNDELVIPDSVTLVDTTTCTVNLVSYSITGSWHAKVVA